MKSTVLVVVPVKGKPDVLGQCLSSIIKSVSRNGSAKLVVVDNNDGDQLDPILQSILPGHFLVKSRARTVGGVRNDGVRAAGGSDAIVFVDCDCEVHESFVDDVLNVFEMSKAEIVGCKVKSPDSGHWTEVTMDQVHRQGGDGFRSHLNSGCLAIKAEAFSALGGFDDRLPSSEDYDLCDRARALGFRLFQSERLAIIHWGNPKSTSGYFKRLRWHGRGAVSATGTVVWSRMLFATLANAGVVGLGAIAAIARFAIGDAWGGILLVVISLVMIPFAFVVMRMVQLKRRICIFRGIGLMQVTFAARFLGFLEQKFRFKQVKR